MAFNIQSVLITDDVDPKCVTILQNSGIKVVQNTTLSKEQLLSEILNYDGLIVRSATRVTADVIDAGKQLKIIGRAGTGVDNIDVEAATKRGIVVMNTPGGNTLSAAEHTCTLIIALTRNLGSAVTSMKDGKWERKKFMGSELLGKTLAIIGLGRIGKEVAFRMQAFGMTTIGFDPVVSKEESAQAKIEWLSLEEIWPRADYITVHTPLIPQTKNLINAQVFAKCKRGVRVVNCARGGIIDEQDLLEALQSGQCGGAGLDVFLEEPPTDFSLAKHPNVVATPHLGASTIEAQSRVAEEIAQQFVELKEKSVLTGAVNAPALIHALSSRSQPWVQLGQKLGVVARLFSQDWTVNSIKLNLSGPNLKDGGAYLPASVLVGYLSLNPPAGGDSASNQVNLISAPFYAKQIGITTSSTYQADPQPAGGDVVRVELLGANGQQLSLEGSVAGSTSVLLSLQSSQFLVPAHLRGSLVLYQAHKSTTLAQILNAALQDELQVLAVSSTESTASSVYGVLNVAFPVAASNLKSLSQAVDGVFAHTF